MSNHNRPSLNLDEQCQSDLIAEWVNGFIPQGVTAKVAIKGTLLKVVLESNEVPDRSVCVDLMREKVSALRVKSPWQLRLYGREVGEDVPEWQEEMEITPVPTLGTTEKAREGDVEAIAALVSQWVDNPSIETQASIKNGSLRIVLTASEFPEPSHIATQILHHVTALAIPGCTSLKVSGREPGDEIPDWQQEFDLQPTAEGSPSFNASEMINAIQVSPEVYPNRLELARRGDSQAICAVLNYLPQSKGLEVGTKLSGDRLLIVVQSDQTPEQEKTVAYIRSALEELKIDSLKQVSLTGRRKGATFAAWTEVISLEQQGNFWDGMVGAVGGAAMFAGGAAADAVGLVGNAAAQAGGAIAGTAVGVAGAIGGAAMQATDGVGYVIEMVMSDPGLQEVTKALKVDWLLTVIDRVDIVKAATEVKNLQQKSPNSPPSEIAHQIMVKKALLVGGSGFASSLVPALAASLFAVDLMATMAIQAEMVYQIACAYGMNLQDPARKGEILAIFGMALGGSSAIKAGLSLVRNVPGVGAVIGASSNAAMLYALGYASCRFYEAKLNPSSTQMTLLQSQAESETDLQQMYAQQVVMDQILLHLVLAGNPGQSLQQLLPAIGALNLSPVTLDAVTKNATLPPLEQLLLRLNQDFAVVLIAQCQKVAQADGIVTPAEAKMIEAITGKFGALSGS